MNDKDLCVFCGKPLFANSPLPYHSACARPMNKERARLESERDPAIPTERPIARKPGD